MPKSTSIFPSIGALPREQWDRLYGGAAEGFDYHRACEQAEPASLRFSAAGVMENDRLVAGVPLLRAVFRLDMFLQGRFGWAMRLLERTMPRLVCIPVLCAGSPHTDELALGLVPELDAAGREQALDTLLHGLMRHARTEQTRADVIGLKDVGEAQAAWADGVLRQHGYCRIATLPVAVLDLPFQCEADYIASLSQNQRSSLRRKLRKAADIRVEIRTSIEGLERDIAALREATRQAADVDYGDFEQVAPGYFASVMREMPGRAQALLYWRGETLLGFALVFLEPRRLIFQYIGMRYPQARDAGIYFLNWMTMVRLCIERGIPELRAGQTTYLTKCRLGCRLERSWIYFRHRTAGWNAVFKLLSPWFGIDRLDPDLRQLGASAPYGGRPAPLPDAAARPDRSTPPLGQAA